MFELIIAIILAIIAYLVIGFVKSLIKTLVSFVLIVVAVCVIAYSLDGQESIQPVLDYSKEITMSLKENILGVDFLQMGKSVDYDVQFYCQEISAREFQSLYIRCGTQNVIPTTNPK